MQSATFIARPALEECATFYQKYIEQAPGEDGLSLLRDALDHTTAFLQDLPQEKWDFRYAPGKWSLKESFIHLADAERVFAYRALRISRHDPTPLPGFDQDTYIPYYHADRRSPESIIEEYQSVRRATITLFQQLDEEALNRSGTVSGGKMTVRALAFIIAGHEQHHLRLTRERYL